MMSSFRVLVTGSREIDAPAEALVCAALELAWLEAAGDVTIVHGAARGVDTVAQFWAVGTGVPVERHAAAWNDLGGRAGPLRNQAMVDLGASVCLAFPRRRSVGTWDCIRRAATAGIPVRIYPLEAVRGG
jgi:hypothetical protein